MAIIDGKVPEPAQEPGASRRVVVKFRPDAKLRNAAEARDRLDEASEPQWRALEKASPGIVLEPYFSTLGQGAREGMDAPPPGRGDALAPLIASYFGVVCPPGVDPDQVSRTLADWPSVEAAYVEAGPTPPPLNPGANPRNANQRYEDAAPVGIDARWIWPVADGSGVGFVDVEQGWTLNHEDLIAANIGLISGVNQAYRGHGTAVLGEVVAVDNTLGGMGIAPLVRARVVSQYRTAANYNTADAILSAASVMSPGDVMLIEAQTTHPNVAGFVPVEVEQATFDAIRAATAMGIVVVEAGANGSVDLDTFRDSNNKRILNRSDPDFRDSGAILVGAASGSVPHGRLNFSNHGSRVDCYAWGEGIDTAGDGWTGNLTNTYTGDFGGTSGATPIVAGAALLLQSWRVRQGLRPFTTAAMRALLTDPGLNTPSASPGADRIGVMPNLRAIVEHERRLAVHRDDRWSAVVQVLFGVTNDGGGVVIGPGVGPVPVGPWSPRVARLSPATRDILVGLAITELSTLVEDAFQRRDVTGGAIALMRQALDRFEA